MAAGQTTIGDQKYQTLELVERMRAFRGRLTRRLLCLALGFKPQEAYTTVQKLCMRFEIETADEGDGGWFKGKIVEPERRKEHPQPEPMIARKENPPALKAHHAIRVQITKAQLAAEIQLAKAEAATAPQYKVGGLEW